MKISKQELKQRISDAITDNDDLVISLLEDVEDSMVENSESVMDETKMKEFEELKWKYDDLKAKYKERFLKGDDKPDEDAEDDEELKEEEVIDVKEI